MNFYKVSAFIFVGSPFRLWAVFYKGGHVRGLIRNIFRIRMSSCGIILAASFALAPAGPVAADESDPDGANIPVRKRSEKEFEPSGVYFGSLLFYPEVNAGLAFDSNVFGSSTSPSDDITYVLAPKLTILKTTEAQRHELDLAVRHMEFQRFDSETRTEGEADLRSTWELAEGLRLDSALQAKRNFEERGDSLTAGDSETPIGYYDMRASAFLTKQFNAFGIIAGGSVKRLAYEDGETPSGVTIDQSFRDGMILTGRIKPFYEFSPGYRIYADIQINQRNYEGEGAFNRDSSGYDARGGVEFPLTPIVFGSIEAGYIEQYYDNPFIATARGPSGKAELTWLMTPLMTVSLYASRSTVDVAAIDQGARIDFTMGGQLDYEIMRNLIVTIGGTFRDEDFVGIDRNDQVLNAVLRADYKINQYFALGMQYRYIDRSSSIDDLSSDRHLMFINLSAKY